MTVSVYIIYHLSKFSDVVHILVGGMCDGFVRPANMYHVYCLYINVKIVNKSSN